VREEAQKVEAQKPEIDLTPPLAHAAFGLSLLAHAPPPGAWAARPSREPRLQICNVAPQAIQDGWSGLDAVGWEGFIDGAPFVVERGVAGDHRFVHGALPDPGGVPTPETRAVHHLSTDAGVLRCAPSDPSDPSWWRVVLDSVLFTVALLQGYEALHAGAIATPQGAIAVTAATGGGKSTLLAELLGRGLELMADDVLVLESRGTEVPLAHPAPPLMTVPAASSPAGSEAAPAQTICSIEGERWIAVPVHPEPLALKALIVLDRRPGSGPGASLRRIESPLAPLLDALIGFPRSTERQRARFELASVLSQTVGLWRLAASLDTPPDVLADTLSAGGLWKCDNPRRVD
jgi:hypothetical protein